MKRKTAILLYICIVICISSFAQQEKMTPEEKQEKNAAREARMARKSEYATFHRQMLALKEYAGERKKIPALQKGNKEPVKILAVIDSNDNDDEESKTLIGYIREDMGDNSTNVYEVTYDRTAKKIISVKRTAETADTEATDDNDDAASGKTKKATSKKSKDDDDDDPDDKPSKSHKDND